MDGFRIRTMRPDEIALAVPIYDARSSAYGFSFVVIFHGRLVPALPTDRRSPLPGLTAEETCEFRHLDSMSAADKTGWPLIGWEAHENDFPATACLRSAIEARPSG
jgi:hypothetical protein